MEEDNQQTWKVGDYVMKAEDYPGEHFMGIVLAAFKTTDGDWRFAVQETWIPDEDRTPINVYSGDALVEAEIAT
jgi:hypothetical protein